MLEGNRQRTAHATEYVVKAEAEFPEVRDGILQVMDEDLISLVSRGELVVLYSNVKGDYYQYAGWWLRQRRRPWKKSLRSFGWCIVEELMSLFRK